MYNLLNHVLVLECRLHQATTRDHDSGDDIEVRERAVSLSYSRALLRYLPCLGHLFFTTSSAVSFICMA